MNPKALTHRRLISSHSPNYDSETLRRRHRPDYALLLISAVLLTVGLVVIYAISPGLSLTSHVSQNYYIDKQMISIAIGVIAFLVVANVRLDWLRRLQNVFIIIAALSAVAVRLVGQEVNGAYRWIQVGGISFQSAELIKMALLIWLAGFLADRIQDGTIKETKIMKPILAVLLAIGIVVAGVQSDLGSSGVMILMIVAMIYIAGVPLKKLISIGLIVLVLASLAIASSSYRRERVLTLFHPTSNCSSTGYQACQAIISVGSGGFIGLGLGRSVQAYGYLPEPANDSIFAIFGEKFGFIGSLVLLSLYLALFWRLKNIIERAPNNFTRLFVVGVLVWLSAQAFINIGAMIGLLPFEGITLPFVSYGGTSILFVLAAIGIVFQISRYTSHRVAKDSKMIEGNGYEDRLNGRRLRGAYNTSSSNRT